MSVEEALPAAGDRGHALKWSVRLLKLYFGTFRQGRRLRSDFRGIEAFCCFLGYPRSGHSLVGALVDAHPEAVISQELNALQYFKAGFGRDQLFALILSNSAHFALTGQTHSGYTYLVPNQWQGRYRRLRIIGDKRGAGTAEEFWLAPDLLDRLERTVAVPLRFIHVVRNPFDNIASMKRKSRRLDKNLSESTRRYARRCDSILQIKQRLAPEKLFELRHEDLIAQPRETLAALCRFLKLEPDPAYLDDCAGIIYRSPHQSRRAVAWTEVQIEEVHRLILRHSFLAGYSFED